MHLLFSPTSRNVLLKTAKATLFPAHINHQGTGPIWGRVQNKAIKPLARPRNE